MLPELPYLTRDIPAIPCAIKEREEDFVVEELPLYEPCGAGEHLYVGIEKRGIGTLEAITWLARMLGLDPRDIGSAGLKDARGITRQTLSLPRVDAARVQALSSPKLSVLWATPHGNKLRIGHLAGNRFDLRLRGVPRERLGDLRAALGELERRGVPNYFGAQRFGARGESWEVGRALLRRDSAEVLALVCGRSGPSDTGKVRRARELADAGEWERAAQTWPGGFREQIRMCRVMAKTRGNPRAAVRALDRKLARFYVSAWQSWIYNRVLAARIDGLERLLPGDLAWIHSRENLFLVEDAAAEQPRAERLEISATGPLHGERMTQPRGEPAEIEARVLAECGATPQEFENGGSFRPPGGRRPLRFPLGAWTLDAGSDEAGLHARLQFTLPSGCYATAVLREIGKDQLSGA